MLLRIISYSKKNEYLHIITPAVSTIAPVPDSSLTPPQMTTFNEKRYPLILKPLQSLLQGLEKILFNMDSVLFDVPVFHTTAWG